MKGLAGKNVIDRTKNYIPGRIWNPLQICKINKHINFFYKLFHNKRSYLRIDGLHSNTILLEKLSIMLKPLVILRFERFEITED